MSSAIRSKLSVISTNYKKKLSLPLTITPFFANNKSHSLAYFHHGAHFSHHIKDHNEIIEMKALQNVKI